MTSQEPDRDRAVDALLRHTLGARSPAESSDRCLDADTLAAWIDGDLKAADVAVAEAHVSACARCQTMIAALVRATPAVQKPAAWWRRGWVVGSLVPLTAGAIAIAIWVATPDVTQYPASARADVPAQSPAEVSPLRAESAPTSSVAEPPRPIAASPQKPATLVDRMSTPPTNENQPIASNRERSEAKEKTAPSDAPVAGLAPMPAAPPAAAAPATAAAQGFESRVALRDQSLTKHAVASIEVLSPNPAIRWRITASGSIERSGNGGTTWTASPSGVTEDLLGGAAPSPTVCWIVGRGGTVLLSTDGLQWRRVAFPERIDLTVVQATDASIATVTTADNRRFRTADGGRTWTALQEF